MTTSSGANEDRRWVRGIALGVIAIASLLALFAIGFFLADIAFLQARVDRLAPDGSAEQFSRSRIEALQLRAVFFAIASASVAIGTALARRSLEDFALAVTRGLGSELRARRIALVEFVSRDRAHAILLALFCLFYAAFAWGWIDQSARTDEAQTFMTYVTKPWYYVLGRYTTNNHIFYSLLAKGSCATGAADLTCLRMPAYLAGIALIPASYLCMRLHLGRSIGLLTAAMVACSPYAIDFGTNGRGYTTVALLFVALLALAKGLVRGGTPARWVLFVALSVIGFWTVPVMAYPFAMLGIWLAVEAWRSLDGSDRRTFAICFVGSGLAIAGLVALLYAPAFVVTGFGEVVVNETVVSNRPSNPTSLLSQVGDILVYVWKDWTFGLAPFLPALLSLGFIVGCFAPVPESAAHRRLLFALASGLALVLAVTRAVPPSWIFLFSMPVAIGLGFSGWLLWLEATIQIRAPRTPRAIVVALGTLLVLANTWSFVTSDALDKPRWYVGYVEAPEMAERLLANLEAGDAFRGHTVVVPPILFYLRALGVEDPEAFAWRDPEPGRDLYFVSTRHEESGEILEGLRADDDVSVEEVARFDRSALLRIRAVSSPGETPRTLEVPRARAASSDGRALAPPAALP